MRRSMTYPLPMNSVSWCPGDMLTSGWLFLVAVLQTAMAASECLVGCMLQGISPFDEDNEVVWDDREACDSNTIGCEVSALNYPSYTYFEGALWTSTSGADGSSACTSRRSRLATSITN